MFSCMYRYTYILYISNYSIIRGPGRSDVLYVGYLIGYIKKYAFRGYVVYQDTDPDINVKEKKDHSL
jgi:hypothetical protein